MAEGELQQTAAGCYFRTDPAYSIIPGRKQTTHLPLPLPVPYIFTPPPASRGKKGKSSRDSARGEEGARSERVNHIIIQSFHLQTIILIIIPLNYCYFQSYTLNHL